MPHKRVTNDIHFVAQAEVHKSVRRAEFVAIRALSRMDHLPLEIILRRNLVELFFDESNVLRALLGAPTESGVARRNVAIDGGADEEVILECVLQRGGFVGGSDVRADGQQCRHH